eukprot:7214335-Prymnesium_polylepis.1
MPTSNTTARGAAAGAPRLAGAGQGGRRSQAWARRRRRISHANATLIRILGRRRSRNPKKIAAPLTSLAAPQRAGYSP